MADRASRYWTLPALTDTTGAVSANVNGTVDQSEQTMPHLKDHITEWLGDWQNGLSPAWREIVGVDAGPNCMAIRQRTIIRPDQTIFPARHPNQQQGLPAGSHIYRALAGLSPNQVTVLLMGQDPYTTPLRATGRSFETGDHHEWHTVGRVTSLRRICQQLVAKRSGNALYQGVDSWQDLRHALENGDVQLPTIGETFNQWQQAGVLLLNRALTATTRPAGMRGSHPHLREHLALWEPMVQRICCHLGQEHEVVFVLLGQKAQKFFDAIPRMPANVRTVRRSHPAFTDRASRNCPFLDGPNLFNEINQGLAHIGREPIVW